jgi:uncharacterized protein YndB with AHSA1/START domain
MRNAAPKMGRTTMTDSARSASEADCTRVVARRLIQAPIDRVFAAWTEPRHLVRWWGPEFVTCPDASVDLRVGGAYRLANRFPDGKVVWVSGEFLEVEPPRRLVYTWLVGEPEMGAESTQVTVRFEPNGGATEVVVWHDRIRLPAMRDRTSNGWQGCLQGLARYLESANSGGPAAA